jgi:type II secretory pathway component PulK
VNRSDRGFALITVLWLITALAALVALDLGAVRLGSRTSANRIVLTRGRWAAEACLAIAQARWVAHRLPDTATIDLGRRTRCAWTLEDPSTGFNLNTVEPDVLLAAGFDLSFVRVVVERRRQGPIEDPGQLVDIPGYDSSRASLVTVTGPGAINLAAASRPVIGALPGMTPESVERLLYRRAVGRPVASLDELAGELSPPARAELLAHYADLARLTSFAAAVLVLRATGWVEGAAPVATVEEVVVPLPERLAITGRRMW